MIIIKYFNGTLYWGIFFWSYNVLIKTMAEKNDLMLFSLSYQSRRFRRVSVLGWCQKIRVLAEIPLLFLSTVSDWTPTSVCSGRLECTHTLRGSEIIYFCVHFCVDAFHYSSGSVSVNLTASVFLPRLSLCLSAFLFAGLPACLSICLHV